MQEDGNGFDDGGDDSGDDKKMPAKNDFVLSDSDDSSDEEEEEAALGGGKPEFPIKIITIRYKEDGMNGFAFYCTGYADQRMGKILWERKGNKHYLKFLDHINCTQWVCKPLQAGSMTDFRENEHDYAYRTGAVILEKGQKPDRETITKWFDEKFLPAFKTVVDAKLGGLRDEQWPGIDLDDTFEEVGTWSEAVDADSIPFVYKKFAQVHKLGAETMKTWINKGSDRLYSIWREGCVPKTMFKRFAIKPELLDPLDHEYLVAKTKKRAEPSSAKAPLWSNGKKRKHN